MCSSTPSCRLCGLPLTGRVEAKAQRDEDENSGFCCTGCAVIFSILGRSSKGEAGGSSSELSTWTLRLGISIFLTLLLMVVNLPLYGEYLYHESFGYLPDSLRSFAHWMSFAISLPIIYLLGDLQWQSARRVSGRYERSFHQLILLSVGAAFLVSCIALINGGETIYFDTCVMLLVLVTLGRVIEGHQRYKSLHQVNEFLHRESQVVEVMRDNELTETTVNEILAGDVFTVKVNERNPVLARVEDGESHFSTEWRNGEFVQEAHQKGSMVQPGDLNIHAPVRLVALQAGNDDNDWLRYSNSLKKAFAETTPIEQTAHQLARVLLITIIPLAIITSAIVGWQAQSIGPAIERLLSILLVACPCALGIATPLVLRLGLNRALSSGFCFRSASIFEPLAKCRRLAFDITGTLTTRTLGIQSANIHDDNFHSANVYRLLNMMINSSSHPKAEALMRWTKEQEEQGFNNNNHKPDDNISKIEYKPGKGVVAYLDSGKRAVLGNSALAKDVFPAINHLYQDTTCYCYDGKVLASFTFAYSWRESLEKILEELKTKTNLTLAAISGGSVLPESSNTESPLFHETFLEQTPEAKQQLVASWEKNSQPTAMIGDGANDLPALMKASVSMAFDDPDAATTESVDITLHPSAFSHLPALFSLARRVKHIIRFNLAWVLLYNSLAVTAAVFGWLHPVIATLIMILSSVTVLAVSCLVTAPPPFRQSQKSTEEILNQLRTVQGKPSAVAGPA